MGHMRADQSPDSCRIDIRHIRKIQNQPFCGIRAHPVLKIKKVGDQEWPTESHYPACVRTCNIFDSKGMIWHPDMLPARAVKSVKEVLIPVRHGAARRLLARLC